MGGRGYGGGGRGRVYTYRYTVTTRMTCIKMGSDESHFNVLLIVRGKVIKPCPQITIFEEKGEPKRYRTEVLLLTSLPRSLLTETAIYRVLHQTTPLHLLQMTNSVIVFRVDHDELWRQTEHETWRSTDPETWRPIDLKHGDRYL